MKTSKITQGITVKIDTGEITKCLGIIIARQDMIIKVLEENGIITEDDFDKRVQKSFDDKEMELKEKEDGIEE